MSRKSKSISNPTPSTTDIRAAVSPPAEVENLEILAARQGIRPRTDMDQFVEEFRDVWPDDSEIDEFLTELGKWRREEREES